MKYIWFGGLVAVVVAAGVYGMQPRTTEAPTVTTDELSQPKDTSDIRVIPDAVNSGRPFPSVAVSPIEHATFVLSWGDTTFYVDPVGDAERFSAYVPADIILVTDIHGDHFSTTTITAVTKPATTLYVPQAVYDELPPALQGQSVVLENGEAASDTTHDVTIEAVAMYNTTPERSNYHPEGRGNGYLLSRDRTIYIAGDTEETPEMRALEDIDIAFLPMNVPYTMDVEAAAEAVAAFAPTIVYPYHYRGTDGLSDIESFSTLVKESGVKTYVGELTWYPNQ